MVLIEVVGVCEIFDLCGNLIVEVEVFFDDGIV